MPGMDSVLIISDAPDNYASFLERLGYHTIKENPKESENSVTALLDERIIDLILVDGNTVSDHSELVTYFRNQDLTKLLPILVIGEENGFTDQRIERLAGDASKGIIASRIATLLRLRKMDGKSPEAHIIDLNLALRDFTEKLTKDLQEAQKIQIATLPKETPHGPSFDIAYFYEPLEELGGDWFYIHEEEDGSISFIIADVTGHGLAAALIGGWIKLGFGATAGITDPAQRLARMNDLITPQMPDGRFITMSCVNYNPTTSIVRQARGGHPATVLLKSANHATNEILGNGFALGFLEGADYEQIETSLDTGDVLVLCTDGIAEAQNMNSKFYGTEGIQIVLRDLRPEASAHDIMEKIIEDLKNFTGGRSIKDDLTLIVLKRTK
jgi:serine phosphatase RsbU (regulator of sigma subunit)